MERNREWRINISTATKGKKKSKKGEKKAHYTHGYEGEKYPYCTLCNESIVPKDGQSMIEAVEEHMRKNPNHQRMAGWGRG